jgi:hypothetical protein
MSNFEKGPITFFRKMWIFDFKAFCFDFQIWNEKDVCINFFLKNIRKKFRFYFISLF